MTIPTASSVRRAAAPVVALLLATAPVARRAGAQASRAAPATPGSPAVAIQLRPHVGDVFRTRLDQLVEVTGTTRHGSGDTTVSVRTDLLVLTHSRIEAADSAGTTVVAVTDSVMLFTTGSADAWTEQTMRRLKGQSVRMHLAPDGGVSMADPKARGDRELRALVAQMPALLPRDPVVVGSTWSRAMAVPVAGRLDARLGATVVATFRLDSLVGDLAWISMEGTLQPMKPRVPDDIEVDMNGTVDGWVVVDRRRGWIVEARTLLAVRSSVAGGNGAAPMKFRTRIEQRLRAR